MNILKAKRVRHYLRLTYPIAVVAQGAQFHGCFPDLPGCEAHSDELPRLYAMLEKLRRQWITERVLAEQVVPVPNTRP